MSGQVIKEKYWIKVELIFRTMIVAADSSTDTDFEGNFSINAKVGEVLKLAWWVWSLSVAAWYKFTESKTLVKGKWFVIGHGTRKKIDNTTCSSLKAEEISKPRF
jgi:hypothetical protein